MFGGVFSVLPTPFTPDGDVDFRALLRVIDLFLEGYAPISGYAMVAGSLTYRA